MKANELRIGNIVNYESREFEIEGISKEYPFLNTIEFGVGVVDWKDLEGTPLSEDWLLRFGFEKKEPHGWKGNGADYQPETSKTEIQDFVKGNIIFRDHKWSFRKDENSIWKTEQENMILLSEVHHAVSNDYIPFKYPLKFVHQFQNLTFALTGEELTIKQ